MYCIYLSTDGNRFKVLYNDEVAGSCFEATISYTQTDEIHQYLSKHATKVGILPS